MADESSLAPREHRASGAVPGGLAGPLARSTPGASFWFKLLSFVVVFAAWEWAGRIPIGLAFPTFSATVGALLAMIADGTLLAAYADTIVPLAIGVGLCGLGAVALGVGMGLSRTFEWFTLPLFVILQAAPSAAIVPVITFIYGIGLAAKVFAVVLLSAPVIVLNSYRGIRNVSPSLLEMSRSFMATRWQQVTKIVLPAASGMIFAGLRLGVAQGFTGAILAELLITPTGVGDLITYHRSIADYPRMFASILSIIVFAAVTLALLQRVERRAFRPELRQAA
ncbi:MAG TPA: ABC transporter permease [Geminicoccaceae bacterium]|nr:ABC transporter permease [Geminicoccaceae bacterium]